MKKFGHIFAISGLILVLASGSAGAVSSAELSRVAAETAMATSGAETVATQATTVATTDLSEVALGAEATSDEVTNQDIKELTDSIQSLETKLELLIEAIEAQNGEADTSYTEVLGANESSSHLQQEGTQKVAYGVIAGVAVILALACLLLVSMHAKNQQPQTVSEAVDAIVARNQRIYVVPKEPEE